MGSGVLFVHNNFPGQFRHLAQALVARGVPCQALGGANAPGLPPVGMNRYGLSRGSTPGVFPLAVRAEADLIRAASAWRAAGRMKAAGMDPQVIVGHPGWGETALLHEVWPDAKRVIFSEFFYHGRGFDVGFDPEFGEPSERVALTAEAKNAVMAWALTQADAIVTPTEFQASALPPVFRPLTRVIHEGVDIEQVRPAPAEPFALADGRFIAPGTPVITYVNNNLEPLRGLHIFARALPRLMAEAPDAQVLVFGDTSRRAYGGEPTDGRTWREVFFEGLEVDAQRLHFVGKVPPDALLAAMRLSTAHVYYTYPFVLSWSLVEAMAAGCYVVASDTAPVRDAIEDGVNGRLLPFFDSDALATALIEACRDPQASAPLRAAARATAVARFSRDAGLKAWFEVLRAQGLELPA
ncbi:glycosyltransferase [Phenylobacterium sp.]|jgi:glycosyltransferase involved in cell wall biosynthesis|uniref:glycosyltransferase n=1 Tax=Phenylobacterium sp. TaxID=1871053 RepID=UPI002F42F62F